MIRQSLLLAACALAPFALTGCAGDEKTADTRPVSVASPAPAADELGKELAALSVRIRTADAALTRVVGDSATDPEDRLAALDKAAAALGRTTASSLAAKLKAAGAEVVAGWTASVAAVSDDESRKIAGTGRDEAVRRFAELDKAVRGADASILYHAGLLNDVRSALGARPDASRRVAARAVSKRVTEAGEKAAGWLSHTTGVAKTAGATPIPAPLAPAAPETPETKPAPEAPAPEQPVNAAPAPAPVIHSADAPAPAASSEPEVKPANLVPAKVTPPSAKPIEPSEPEPAAKPDPVPEPVDA